MPSLEINCVNRELPDRCMPKIRKMRGDFLWSAKVFFDKKYGLVAGICSMKHKFKYGQPTAITKKFRFSQSTCSAPPLICPGQFIDECHSSLNKRLFACVIATMSDSMPGSTRFYLLDSCNYPKVHRNGASNHFQINMF